MKAKTRAKRQKSYQKALKKWDSFDLILTQALADWLTENVGPGFRWSWDIQHLQHFNAQTTWMYEYGTLRIRKLPSELEMIMRLKFAPNFGDVK